MQIVSYELLQSLIHPQHDGSLGLKRVLILRIRKHCFAARDLGAAATTMVIEAVVVVLELEPVVRLGTVAACVGGGEEAALGAGVAYGIGARGGLDGVFGVGGGSGGRLGGGPGGGSDAGGAWTWSCGFP